MATVEACTDLEKSKKLADGTDLNECEGVHCILREKEPPVPEFLFPSRFALIEDRANGIQVLLLNDKVYMRKKDKDGRWLGWEFVCYYEDIMVLKLRELKKML